MEGAILAGNWVPRESKRLLFRWDSPTKGRKKSLMIINTFHYDGAIIVKRHTLKISKRGMGVFFTLQSNPMTILRASNHG